MSLAQDKDGPLSLANLWQSRRGNKRWINCDGGVITCTDSCAVAAIFDGAGQSRRTAAFVTFWLQYFARAAAVLSQFTASTFDGFIQEGRRLARSMGFFSEKASYAVVVNDKKTNRTWLANCGDCRVGRHDGCVSKLDWLTPVHTAANPLGESFDREHAAMPERHLLTRHLNARFPSTPSVVELDTATGGSWILATDGYWLEHQLLGIGLEDLEDDASLMLLPSCTQDIEVTSQVTNFRTFRI